MTFSPDQLRNIVNSISAHIAVIDDTGRILETNAAWKHFSRQNGLPESADFRQMNYFKVCRAAGGQEAADARAVEKGILSVMAGKTDEFVYDYPCHSPDQKRWFYMRAVLMADSRTPQVIISHEDITALKLAQESLRKSQALLEDQNRSLEEANVALKVLLRQRDIDRKELENRFLTNIKTLVLPYIEKLKNESLSERNKTLIRIVDDHIKDIASSLMTDMASAGVMLTPQEIQVAALVKDGKSSAEICDILFVSEATVNFHRRNLRTKLGLKNRRINLRSHLLSMSS